MELTSEQEATLLKQYDGFIRNAVKEICRRGSYRNSNDMEDLMQEGRLAFLLHLRSMDHLDDIKLCKRDILAAMWKYWQSMALISIPYNKLKKEINNIHRTNWSSGLWIFEQGTENPCESAALIQDFMSGQEEDDKTVIRMKLDGYNSREIIPIVHAHGEPQMSRMLNRIRKKTAAYFAQ